jgi:hypothetical protein
MFLRNIGKLEPDYTRHIPHRAGSLSGNALELVFGTYRVRISTGTLAILTKEFVVFLSRTKCEDSPWIRPRVRASKCSLQFINRLSSSRTTLISIQKARR